MVIWSEIYIANVWITELTLSCKNIGLFATKSWLNRKPCTTFMELLALGFSAYCNEWCSICHLFYLDLFKNDLFLILIEFEDLRILRYMLCSRPEEAHLTFLFHYFRDICSVNKFIVSNSFICQVAFVPLLFEDNVHVILWIIIFINS